MTTTTAAPTTISLYPTTDLGEHKELDFAANSPDQYCPFTWLLDFCKDNEFSMRHDPESDATTTGWYIEDVNGVQQFAAIIK